VAVQPGLADQDSIFVWGVGHGEILVYGNCPLLLYEGQCLI
jgi:hypothetical protein